MFCCLTCERCVKCVLYELQAVKCVLCVDAHTASPRRSRIAEPADSPCAPRVCDALFNHRVRSPHTNAAIVRRDASTLIKSVKNARSQRLVASVAVAVSCALKINNSNANNTRVLSISNQIN